MPPTSAQHLSLRRPLPPFTPRQAAFKAFSRPHPRISPWSPPLPYPDALPCREPESADFRPAAMLTPPLIPEKSPTGSVLYLHLRRPLVRFLPRQEAFKASSRPRSSISPSSPPPPLNRVQAHPLAPLTARSCPPRASRGFPAARGPPPRLGARLSGLPPGSHVTSTPGRAAGSAPPSAQDPY